ncbi:MAG: heavy-metal-associated domain-containing protein [Treponemataceae bacterium]
MKKLFTVDGMSCNHCVNHVTEAVLEINGVKEALVDLAKKELSVEFNDEKICADDIIAAVENAVVNAGYECSVKA